MSSNQTQERLLKHLDFIIMDAVVMIVSFLLAYFLRLHRIDIFGENGQIYLHQIILMLLALSLSLIVGDPYKNIVKRDRWLEFKRTIKHAFNMMLVNVVCLYFLHEASQMSRKIIALTWGFYVILEFCFRQLWKTHLQKKFQETAGKRSMVVITNSIHADHLVHNMNMNPLKPFVITGIFLSDLSNNYKYGRGDEVQGNKILGNANDAIEFTTHNWVDEVTVYLPEEPEMADKLIDTCDIMGVTSHRIVAKITSTTDDKATQFAEKMGDYISSSRAVRVVSPWQHMAKRTLDIVGGTVGVIFTGLLTLIVGPAIYLKSPGPIFFSQQRVGKNGKPFKMYKFRSMYMDAEERKKELMEHNKIASGMMFKMDDDPRIIGSEKKGKDGKPKGIGNFIRNTSIDEFPQFVNVLKGDMSLVGTRPPTMDEWEHYSPEHRTRMSIRPGITGMWQISGRSNITDFDEVVALDAEYAQNWTVGMDMRILVRTVGQVLKHDGAA